MKKKIKIKKYKRKGKSVKAHTRKINKKKPNYSSYPEIKGHKIKIGAKPGSRLTEKEIEDILWDIPEKELHKLKRVNLADEEDYIRQRGQKIIPKREPGFVHPKRTRDVNLINQQRYNFKDVVKHEVSHSMTLPAVKAMMKEELARSDISHKEKQMRIATIWKKAEEVADNYQEEVFKK